MKFLASKQIDVTTQLLPLKTAIALEDTDTDLHNHLLLPFIGLHVLCALVQSLSLS